MDKKAVSNLDATGDDAAFRGTGGGGDGGVGPGGSAVLQLGVSQHHATLEALVGEGLANMKPSA